MWRQLAFLQSKMTHYITASSIIHYRWSVWGIPTSTGACWVPEWWKCFFPFLMRIQSIKIEPHACFKTSTFDLILGEYLYPVSQENKKYSADCRNLETILLSPHGSHKAGCAAICKTAVTESCMRRGSIPGSSLLVSLACYPEWGKRGKYGWSS